MQTAKLKLLWQESLRTKRFSRIFKQTWEFTILWIFTTDCLSRYINEITCKGPAITWDINTWGITYLISINSSIPFSALRKGRTFEWWGRGGGWHHVALKQCPVCKNVLCSICSKATIKTDDTWLIMILAAKHNAMKISKQLFDGKDDVLSDI